MCAYMYRYAYKCECRPKWLHMYRVYVGAEGMHISMWYEYVGRYKCTCMHVNVYIGINVSICVCNVSVYEFEHMCM